MKFIFVVLALCVLGCQTTSPYQKKGDAASTSETASDVRSAIESVAGAVTQAPAKVNYCPVCGRRFSPSVTTCPFDGAVLKEVE